MTSVPPDLTREAVARRVTSFQQILAERGIDAAIVTRPANIYYLAGYRAAGLAAVTSRLHALVVPVKGEPVLLIRSLERITARETTPVRCSIYDDDQDPYESLVTAVGEACPEPPATVGIELERITAAQCTHIVEGLGERGAARSTADISGTVEMEAMRMTATQQDYMRHAAHVSTAGLNAGLAGLRPGRSAAEVVGEIQAAMYGAGQTDVEKSFVMMWSGPDGGWMHDTRLAPELADTDVATVEVMGVDHHYSACAQATVAVGDRPPAEFRATSDLVHAMHDAARSVVRHGVEAREVFEAASEVYRQARGDHYYRRVGGSMGLTAFGLDLRRGNTTPLESGMPLLVQTLVDDPLLVACGTTVLVTETGFEPLTTRPDDPVAASRP